MFLISFSIPIFHNSIPLSKMADSPINRDFADKRNFHVLQDTSHLINTRVNIMHIKINQRTPKFDGKEATLYAMKMSYLYRIVILNQLGIAEKLYDDNLRKRVCNIDKWNKVQKSCLIG